MSIWTRVRNLFQSDDVRLVAWLDSLRADAVFGWRQVRKRKGASAAAILSLGLALGACTAAFRLIDAMLLRPLPVAGADRLYVVAREGLDPGGNFRISESSEYPLFERLRAAVAGDAEVIAASYEDRADVTFRSDEEMEKVHHQYVSGTLFEAFGLHPKLGRLLSANDDQKPGAHPYAVLSYDYWTRRFGQDPKVVGQRFRMADISYEVVGILSEGFTGTEPGAFIDVFLPAMMHPGIKNAGSSWLRPFVILRPGVAEEPVLAKLRAVYLAFLREQAGGEGARSSHAKQRALNQKILLLHAATGVSVMQKESWRLLLVLGVMVTLVLLIACANVANLMTAQASARAREMALRVSIGAGRRRLVQMVLVESAWIGLLAASVGAVFASWAAPFVVSRINPPDNPLRLLLPADWRVMAFSFAVALAVTFLFGLAPALRASSVKPSSALKGGDDPHSRRRLMHGLIAVQVAFCFLVHFSAGLFVTTFERMAKQPVGFAPERLLTMEATTQRPQPQQLWDQAAEGLRAVPGVESVALAKFPLLSGNGWNGSVWVNNEPTEVLAYYLGVSSGWIETMGIPLVEGRDLRANESYPGAAIVNESFVRQCLGGGSAVGRWFERHNGNGVPRDRFQIVGVVRDARYRNMREPITPTAYVPFRTTTASGELQPKSTGAYIVRTSGTHPSALASQLRREMSRAWPEIHVSNLRTQTELVEQHTVKERLLAMLALFFSFVALLLAGVGLYGVLDYSVVQRRREIGIRLAIGAPARDIVRRVTADVAVMVLAGMIAGLVLGLVTVRYIEALLYGVQARDASMLAMPSLTILFATMLAGIPAVWRALRIDPAAMLRSE